MAKVWQAFSKYVKSQSLDKGRVVDTTLIGTFMPDANQNCIFLPSPEYLEAGKFKLPKSIMTEINHDPSKY